MNRVAQHIVIVVLVAVLCACGAPNLAPPNNSLPSAEPSVAAPAAVAAPSVSAPEASPAVSRSAVTPATNLDGCVDTYDPQVDYFPHKAAPEATFAGNGIDFDRRRGTFELHPPARRRATLEGDGIAATWTARALERCGYVVVEAGEAASVRVVVHESPAAWDVTLPNGTPRHVHSLHELATLLP